MAVATQRRGAERTQSQRSTIDFARAPSAAGLLPDPWPKPIMPILTGQKGGFTGTVSIYGGFKFSMNAGWGCSSC